MKLTVEQSNILTAMYRDAVQYRLGEDVDLFQDIAELDEDQRNDQREAQAYHRTMLQLGIPC